MADRYVVLPAHVVRQGVVGRGDHQSAIHVAMGLVEKDRTPRVVVRVLSEIHALAKSQLEVTRFEEAPNDGSP